MWLGSGVAMSYGVGHRRGSDPKLLWLWCRPAAIAPIPTLAGELRYAAGVTLKSNKQKTNKHKIKKKQHFRSSC